MSSLGAVRRRRLDRALSGAAFVLGLPGTLGMLTGAPPADWPLPLGPQHHGDFALRTVIYLSGFLTFFGAIGLAWTLAPGGRAAEGEAAGSLGGPAQSSVSESGDDQGRQVAGPAPGAPPPPSRARGEDSRDPGSEAPVSVAEPLYGFLPREAQERIAGATGYRPLLFTKISILLSGGIGVLLAGSFEFLSELEPIPAAGAARVLIGLYLMAESVQRYILFARREPTGTLAGWLVYRVASALGPRSAAKG